MCSIIRLFSLCFQLLTGKGDDRDLIDEKNLGNIALKKNEKLSNSEEGFRKKRQPTAMKAIQELLGEERGPRSVIETPTIALVISGGGYRAVSTSCGATEALMENGLFDALMYSVGLSGSVWYLSSTYIKKSFSDKDRLTKTHDWLRGQLGEEMRFNRDLTLLQFFKKALSAQKLSLVDSFGNALKDIFLPPESKSAKLSSLIEYVNEGGVPLPIFAAAHVKNYFPVPEFWEEVEFTPYEATYASYRLQVPVEFYNSVWDNGVLRKLRYEPFLHYIMGLCGSAFGILLYHLQDGNEEKERSYFDFIRSLVNGEWATFLPSGLSVGPRVAMTKDQFKETIWKVLKRIAEEERIELGLDEAYEMYLYRFNTDDYQWIESLLVSMEHQDLPEDFRAPEEQLYRGSEMIGRNIGPLQRTGILSNPIRGMSSSVEKYMLNDQPIADRKSDTSIRIAAKASTKDNDILLVDAGLGCNIPAIYAARPHRKVDIMLVVDCETKSADVEKAFTTLEVLQKQMSDNNMKFPPIDIDDLKQDPKKEYYLFEDAEDPDCPVVIWFTLYNVRFREQQNPPRSDEYPPEKYGGKKFADFDVTPACEEYGTTNFQYTPRAFDRLRELMKYNVGHNMEVVREKLEEKVQHLRRKLTERPK